MHARYSHLAQFYVVYIREAHPADGWRMESNDRAGIIVEQPRTAGARTEVAARCCATLDLAMPVLVDGIDNAVSAAYSAFPDRLYLVGKGGRVVYKGGRGPFGFDPRELEQELILELLEAPEDQR